MNNEKYQKYIYWGVTAFLALSGVVLVVFLLVEFDGVMDAAGTVTGILAPILYGAVFAYLLAPVYNWIRNLVVHATERIITSPEKRKGFGSFIATIVSVVMWILAVFGIISMMIPQLWESVMGIVEALPAGFMNLQRWLEQVLADNPDMEETVMEYYSMAVGYLQNWVTNDVVPNLRKIIGEVSNGVFTFLNVIKNMLIGIIVMVYLLNMKEKLLTQMKMILYSICPVKLANKLLEEGRYVHQIFGGFIIGKLVDSLIIGIMCFVLLNVMKMPYVLLISVIIGVTNVIPFFGPFIGAIPSAFLILLVSPVKCLYFVIFILLLQQFDGNILGPKILGDSTGLSSFWVLFSILLFGGLFGFVGMIIGVPTFAVIYKLVTELVTYRLGKRRLSADIGKYENLDHIDEDQKTFIKKR
ncbi:MAG: AI-2E family transporter [Lachnospiraceae bacterium]|nr:AI-2E family transporter [Lachnospiraceae bacterium]